MAKISPDAYSVTSFYIGEKMNKKEAFEELNSLERTIKDRKILDYSFSYGLIFTLQTVLALYKHYANYFIALTILGMLLAMVIVSLSVSRSNTALSLVLYIGNPDKRLKQFWLLGKVLNFGFNLLFALLIVSTILLA